MATQSIHSKILIQTAKTLLTPLGIVQKGQSRTWIDDHGWWVIMMEFQPSGWSKGTYLNVGVCWLWDRNNYLSFDVGDRINALLKLKKVNSIDFNF